VPYTETNTRRGSVTRAFWVGVAEEAAEMVDGAGLDRLYVTAEWLAVREAVEARACRSYERPGLVGRELLKCSIPTFLPQFFRWRFVQRREGRAE